MRYPWVARRGTLAALAAVAIIGIRHFPLAASRKRYIRLARRRKGASSFSAAQESAPGGSPHGLQKHTAAHARRHCKRKKWRVLAFSVLYRSGAPVPRPLVGMPR